MTEIETLAATAPTKTTSEIRLVWKIGTKSGACLWYPFGAKHSLLELVTILNAQYGAGTHWIEERAA